jgi:hypothetical protein
MADFNNDGFLDIYHVNGWPFAAAGESEPEFDRDPAPMFVADGDGTFTNRAAELGVNHLGQGRGVVCFDYDRDGDLDILVMCSMAPCLLYRNEGVDDANHLAVKLHGNQKNTEAIGARITVVADGKTQMRELRAGSNFVSQDPAEAHFGLGASLTAESVTILWPDGETTELRNVDANQLLEVEHPKLATPPVVTPKAPRIVGVGPNPFRSETSFDFEIPEGVSGSLRLYDVTGRLIRTVPIPAGTTPTVVWDGRDAKGNSVASGIYLARLETSLGSSPSVRLTLVR